VLGVDASEAFWPTNWIGPPTGSIGRLVGAALEVDPLGAFALTNWIGPPGLNAMAPDVVTGVTGIAGETVEVDPLWLASPEAFWLTNWIGPPGLNAMAPDAVTGVTGTAGETVEAEPLWLAITVGPPAVLYDTFPGRLPADELASNVVRVGIRL
jgi:hypothetical protein